MVSLSSEDQTGSSANARRMKANRASAATSRNKKRKYVECLEKTIQELSAVVETLSAENVFWRNIYMKEDGADSSFTTLLTACEIF